MISTQADGRSVGILLLLSSLAAVFLMPHHPTHFHGGNLNAIVHGGMIAVILLSTFGVSYLALTQEIRRPVVMAALQLYGMGSILNILAALINGFVLPQWIANANGPHLDDIQSLGWLLNQNCGRLAIYLHGAGICLFGIHFLRNAQSRWDKVFSAISFLVGVAGPLVLLMHDNRLTVHTAMVVYCLESCWLFLLSGQLIWSQPRKTETP